MEKNIRMENIRSYSRSTQNKMIREHFQHGVGDTEVKVVKLHEVYVRHINGGIYGDGDRGWQWECLRESALDVIESEAKINNDFDTARNNDPNGFHIP